MTGTLRAGVWMSLVHAVSLEMSWLLGFSLLYLSALLILSRLGFPMVMLMRPLRQASHRACW